MRAGVLIYRLGSMGDMVVALPCFHKIRQSYPDARRILLTNIPISSKAAPSQSILGRGALFDESIAYPLGTRSPAALWKLARQIRRTKASILVYLMPSRGFGAVLRDRVFFRCCGIKTVIGLPTTSELQDNRIDAETGFEEQECRRLARSLSALGTIDLESADAWDLHLSETETTKGQAAVSAFGGRPFLAFNMGGKAAEKLWDEARWVTLLDRLARTYSDHGFLIVGGAEDFPFAESIRNRLPHRVINACGNLSPRECAAALGQAALFVGHDSGPLHLASSVGVTCVGLYGTFNRPRAWHPYGRSHRIIHNLQGMSAIMVDEVESAISEAMTASGSI